MNGFVDLHGASITGVINTFDRVIFKGHLNGFFPDGAFGRYLSRWGILLKDAGRFFEAETQRIRDHVVSLAAAAGRPVEYLAGSSTHRSGTSKEARARAIAERDGVTEGLVCVLSVVEPCRSFAVVPNRQTRRLEVVRRPRKCLHYYLYLIDPAFGWMHMRLQTWAPYEIQVYVNGREWLARQMDRAGLGYRRSDNKITDVDDFGPITALCERFAHTDWPPVLERQSPGQPAAARHHARRLFQLLVGDRPVRVRQRCPVHRPCRLGDDPGRSGERRGHRLGRATDVLHFLG